MAEGFTRLDADLKLPDGHPLAPREAWQCDICHGIFYPNGEQPTECPYCADEDDAA
jgi:rubrerythrin